VIPIRKPVGNFSEKLFIYLINNAFSEISTSGDTLRNRFKVIRARDVPEWLERFALQKSANRRFTDP
jgi:hypothetical protein